MIYIPVLGLAPSHSVLKPTLRYFDHYLVSMAEPTTSPSWSILDIHSHVKHMVKYKHRFIENHNNHAKLVVDSGGYQIITGFITENRIKEFNEIYHKVLKKFKDDIDLIFSLDVNSIKFNDESITKFNDISINSSISLLQELPELIEKQLFVVQSRTPHLLDLWLSLMDKHRIYLYYKKYSFGGLVGLKGETKTQYNHFVPMTLWLMTYLKSRGAPLPSHIHMLGQSSKVALMTGAILEKLTGINISMDSSEIVRFRPITAKLPIIHQTKNDFCLVNNLEDLCPLLDNHSDDIILEELEKHKTDLKNGVVTNSTFVELVCQNIINTINFIEKIIETFGVKKVVQWDSKSFFDAHPVFQTGRLAVEMSNNMRLIREFLPYYETGNFEKAHLHMKRIITTYYDGSKNRTGEIDV